MVNPMIGSDGRERILATGAAAVQWSGDGRKLAGLSYLHYIEHMNTTIRNIDAGAYRTLKARAALEGKTIGEAVNEAIRAWLGRPARDEKRGSLSRLTPRDFPPGNERLSESVDAVVCGD